MKRPIAIATLASIVLLAACKKESDNKPTENNDALVGNYKLMHISAWQYGATEALGEKAAIVNDFTTINNEGTIRFTNSDMVTTGLSYEANSVGSYYMYDGADIVDSFDVPNVWQIPPMNLTAPYELIGADSIYFPQGSFSSGTGGAQQTGRPGGGRYSFNGNLLTITQRATVDTIYVEMGETIHQYGNERVNMVLEKQ